MNKQYIVRDNQEIYGVYNDIAFAYVSVLQYMYITAKNSKCSIDDLRNSFQIFEYNNNIVENIHNIGIDLYLYDINKKIVVCDNISVRDYTTKINNMTLNEEEINDNDMDIFLPMTEVTENKNNRTKAELEGKLKMLQHIKEQEENKLLNLKNQTNEDLNIINDEENRNLFVKRMVANDKERIESMYKKFVEDIKVFWTLRNEMDMGKRKMGDVPDLFEDDYKIFMDMVKNNIFDKNDNEKFDYYRQHKKVTGVAGDFKALFDQANIEQLKQLCFSDTDSMYDDEYDDEIENTTEEEIMVPNQSSIDDITLMEKIINE